MNRWDWFLVLVTGVFFISQLIYIVKYMKFTRDNNTVLKLKNKPYSKIWFSVAGILFLLIAIKKISDPHRDIQGVVYNIWWIMICVIEVIQSTFNHTIIVSNGIAINLKIYKWSEIISWQWIYKKDWMMLKVNKDTKKRKVFKRNNDVIKFRAYEKYKVEVEKIFDQHIQRVKVEE